MEKASTSNASPQPLRILSLDGGGIGGISSLMILEHIMEKIREHHRLDHTPRPCEQFDLIGGTSIGGIIAIMLGRLGMTVDECIQVYRKFAPRAFSFKLSSIFSATLMGSFSTFHTRVLEARMKQTIREFCTEAECVAQRRQGQTTVKSCPHSEIEFHSWACTKTAVLAITKDDEDAPPTLFTTYDTSASFHGCTIWQAMRATSAAPPFFKSIKIGRDRIEFVDAFRYNNPCEILIEEARRQFPGREQMRVLSIGTGTGALVARDPRRWIPNTLKKIAAFSKNVAERLDGQYRQSGQYYRFEVDTELEDITLLDWEKASTVSAYTHNYLRKNQQAFKKFVDDIPVGFGDSTLQTEDVTSLDGGGTGFQELPPDSLPAEKEGHSKALPTR